VISGAIKKIFIIYTFKNIRPPYLLELIGYYFDIFIKFLNPNQKKLSLKRFFKSNRIIPDNTNANSDNLESFEILFVSTLKDFPLLPYALKSALETTSNFSIPRVTILTPDKYVDSLRDLLQDYDVSIQAESIYFDERTLRELKRTFQDRFGWVLQQLLKLKFVLQSESSGVLIIDSDTIILEPRYWLRKDGLQLLTPTWEYHAPYYRFLESVGIGGLNPEYTFVSHHMLMQPKMLEELFQYVGWNNVEDLTKLICSLPNIGEQSPFSLDYELYAQYLYQFHPDKILLGKWSNNAVALPSNKNDRKVKIEEKIENSRNKFASLSFHSYL